MSDDTKAKTLALSTSILPTTKFLVDGVEYQILGMDHLSPNDEAHATALFSRFQYLVTSMELTPNVQKGKALAESIRKTRIAILTKLTDLPAEIAEKLPLGQQAQLMEAIQAEIEKSTVAPKDEDEDDETTVEDEDGTTGGDADLS